MADISYQTSYPTKPDTSREAYNKLYAGKTYGNKALSFLGPNFRSWLGTVFAGNPSYKNWKAEQWDQFNADVQAYDTWLKSGAGIRSSAESGEYNPNYFGEASGASPTQYQTPAGDEFQEGAGSIASFMSQVIGLFSGIANINNVVSKTRAQDIQNEFLREQLQRRNARLGFLADWQKFMNESELFSRYKGLGGDLFNTEYGTYDMSPYVGNGLMYQGGLANIDFVKAGKSLRSAQALLAGLKGEELEFAKEHLWSLQEKLLQGNVDWQEEEKQIRIDAQQNKMNNATAQTVLEIVKFIASIFGIHIPNISTTTTENYDYEGTHTGTQIKTTRQ